MFYANYFIFTCELIISFKPKWALKNVKSIRSEQSQLKHTSTVILCYIETHGYKSSVITSQKL